jgi:hypothetical protein
VRGARGSHPHIREHIRDGGRISYQVHPKLFWPDGTIRHHYAGTFDTLEDAEKARDESLAKLRAERDAERKRIDGDTDARADVEIEGVQAGEVIDADAEWERVKARRRALEVLNTRRLNQSITLPGQITTLVGFADAHIPNDGTDYDAFEHAAEIVARTPGMYNYTAGDMVDQYILGKMADVRFDTTTSIPVEWALAKKGLAMLAGKNLANVGGNHDGWIRKLAGVDYFRDVLASVSPLSLYDRNECAFDLHLGEQTWRWALRHHWAGQSIWNPTHGIERARKTAQAFDFGVGAHVHKGGMVRDFVAFGETCYAVLLGSFKSLDEYPREKGLPPANGQMAVAVMLDARDRTVSRFESIDDAAKFTRLALADAERWVFAVPDSPQG